MWGLITSDELLKWAIPKIWLTILSAILLGLVVGPASAALMMLRVRTTQVGHSSFWLDATESSLFPASLEGSSVPLYCVNISNGSFSKTCPSSGWEELAGYASISRPSIWNDIDFRLADIYDGDYQDNVIELLGTYPNTKRAMYRQEPTTYMITHNIKWSSSDLTTTQSAVLAESLSSVAQMWKAIAQLSRKAFWVDTSFHTLKAWQPYAAVFCESHTIDSTNDVQPITFTDDNYNTHNLTKLGGLSELIQLRDNPGPLTLSFIDLTNLNSSADCLQDVSLGAVVLNGDKSYSSCIIHSGWASTEYNISTASISSPNELRNRTLRTARITPDWASYLNPITDASGTRVFEALSTSLMKSDAGSEALGPVLASLITNGMANVGVGATFHGNFTRLAHCHFDISDGCGSYGSSYPTDPTYFEPPSNAGAENWKEWQVQHFVTGLAYSSDGIVVKLSIVVLLIYATIASVHTVYTILRGNSSSSWRSISELTTLALVSQPPNIPESQNTSAGIYGLKLFRKNVRVVAVDGGKAGKKEGEELQLVLA